VSIIRNAIATAGLALAVTIAPAAAADISGAGATFPFPIYAKWADAYKKETGIGLNYQSIGSGGGIKQIKAKTVVFGATDAPLKGKDLQESGLVQWPMVMGGIVPVVNLAGISRANWSSTARRMARIFLGEIKSWDDAAIQKLNPTAKLPKQAIAVVHRSDGSGTTFNFAFYLAKVSPNGSRRSASTPRCSGRPASAPRATRASPTTSPTPAAPSAMSSTPTPSRTS
jgi:phosphate transport system substrate-binding protein